MEGSHRSNTQEFSALGQTLGMEHGEAAPSTTSLSSPILSDAPPRPASLRSTLEWVRQEVWNSGWDWRRGWGGRKEMRWCKVAVKVRVPDLDPLQSDWGFFRLELCQKTSFWHARSSKNRKWAHNKNHLSSGSIIQADERGTLKTRLWSFVEAPSVQRAKATFRTKKKSTAPPNNPA